MTATPHSTMPRTVLVTGATGQLGQSVVALLAHKKVRLVLLARQASGLQQMYGGLPDSVLVDVDLTQPEQVQARLGQVLKQVGSIDAVCHLAGGFHMGDAVHATPAHTWQYLLDLNASSLLHVAAAVVPSMKLRGQGAIVTVGAAAALKGVAGMGAYCAAKSALLRLTEAMSAELKDDGIRVNSVLPSIIDTLDNRAAMPQADFSAWVSPQALAQVIVFLLSPEAGAVHGAALPVTGRM